MTLKQPAQLDIEQRINNLELNKRQLQYHLQTIICEITLAHMKLKSPIIKNVTNIRPIPINKMLSDINYFIQEQKETIDEKDLPFRRKLYERYMEYFDILSYISSLDQQIDSFKFQSGRGQIKGSSKDFDVKLGDIIKQARKLLKKIKNAKHRKELTDHIVEYERGMRSLPEKLALYQALTNAIKQYKDS